ncbi:MAG: MerR family transcriptional regulator [Brevundimonas sp.]|uniref:MerR family transcriptional regulator n=1 Tax=Brevundimonas sp. TaxID=1871086 RepID=UPI0027157365|nr:MerR family transcriptional regulator [Brevundimonas sp.]MDO9587103.1 MerR family transcriptional regulator [Brevundimonas sp.]MDP3370460.1 MerR family transcriptional regulator [Brevundimonas sp.]MDP3656353.1 MerR family transcriptional regulator [Brevundimonas sp.]MDZ4113063.1 MerR family transcriptional regulator [Brevundimonas sp.]
MAKSPNAFRTISEASSEVGAPQHVLRFWETKFSFLAPLKRAGGRRFYRPQDIVVLKAVKRLLHDEGLTIKGVQRLHKEQGLKRLAHYGDPDGAVIFEPEGAAPATVPAPTASGRSSIRLRQALAELEGARARLDAVLSRSG